MANLSAKPCAGHRRNGFVCGPTIGFKLLYGFVIVRLDRKDLVWINVTTNPTAEWVARQITEASRSERHPAGSVDSGNGLLRYAIRAYRMV
jgi:hypothetical protein